MQTQSNVHPIPIVSLISMLNTQLYKIWNIVFPFSRSHQSPTASIVGQNMPFPHTRAATPQSHTEWNNTESEAWWGMLVIGALIPAMLIWFPQSFHHGVYSYFFNHCFLGPFVSVSFMLTSLIAGYRDTSMDASLLCRCWDDVGVRLPPSRGSLRGADTGRCLVRYRSHPLVRYWSHLYTLLHGESTSLYQLQILAFDIPC